MHILNETNNLANVNSEIRGPLFLEALRMQSEGTSVLKLNTGNPASFGFKMPDSVRNALIENVDRAVPYCDFRGMPEAREAICAYHKSMGIRGITPDDVYIGNGVSEIVTMAITALLNEGDEILVPCPCYSLWSNSALIVGAKPIHYMCDEASDWYPDVDDIESKITPKTKAIVLINPNNPTGAVYPAEILSKIGEIAHEHELVVLSDEIYDRLVMDEIEFKTFASVAPDDVTVITTNGLSKSHLICGFRCGWMVISGNRERNRAFYNGVNKQASMRLCSNALTQLVIPSALEDTASTKSLLVPGGRIYEQRSATLDALDKVDGITYVANHAAFYLFPRIDAKRFGITNDRQFALDLLHSAHVLVIPGSGFDYPTPDHFRLVMLPEADVMAKAIEDIGSFIKNYRV